MAARQKLDLVGIKLSLRQWSRLTREERDRLVTLGCAEGPERDAYRQTVLALIASRADEPAVFLGEISHDDWARDDRMPDAVRAQAERDGIAPPSPAQWRALQPLQRFALAKLARSKHENENFMPAMAEFGLSSARS
ncbi:nitrate reductase associated protein [Acetobacteraceae bacterium KSS8]|uniref:Nitrate reductase associated protein n=2 Tax=Endosaccharibacter trunci TaxID=2812733 RepID=A0ABT1WD86_9PROT|nr:nitrate reductase associated protein [Acetobacteraceae bacterium KSS8]